MRFFILGGTGFIGRHLVTYLAQQNHELDVLVRSSSKTSRFPSVCRFIQGDPLQAGPWQQEIPRADAVINLVGKNIMTRWTERTKKEILNTRVVSTQNTVNALEMAGESKPCLINANAVGFYPDTDDKVHTEDDLTPGDNFLAQVCLEWQNQALQATKSGVRVVIPRFGAVLARDGGVMDRVLPIFRKGLGGKISHGKQPFPWIHINDLVQALEFLAGHKHVHGPVNICAPQQTTNSDFTKALSKSLKRPALFPIPGSLLYLIFGQL
ncbi:MAG TPA: TIGR01777 family oxidoreductase, partial [Desulfohalobiaceae bacterium]|nr:TIGR01777 family oxidoreductase [Desulfohalobiaceae bacterium]